MKTMKFLVMAIAALAIVSCQKEIADDTSKPGAKAKLTISFANSTKSKADRPLTTEDKINNAHAFIFTKEGYLDAEKKLNVGASTVVDATTKAYKVVVVANCGDVADGHYLYGVKKYDDLRSKVAFLTEGGVGTAAGTQTDANGLLMSGIGTVEADVDSEGNLKATVKLEYAVSAINVKWSQAVPTELATVTLQKIVILNANGKSHLVPNGIDATDLSITIPYGTDGANRLYIAGMDLTNEPPFKYVPTGYAQNATLLSKAITKGDGSSSDAADNTNCFYVFENDNQGNFPTIAVIVASWNPVDEDGGNTSNTDAYTTYYPVHLDKDLTGAGLTGIQSIVRGKQYNITMAIKGIGTDDPTNPVKDANVTVTVETATWDPKTIDKEFK